MITELGVGEALVSLLDEKGRPTHRRARLHRAARQPARAARARTSAAQVIAVLRVCGQVREDGRPRIGVREAEGAHRATKPRRRRAASPNPVSDILFGKTGPRGGRQSQGMLEAMTKSAARSIGSELGRQIMRGVLGSILGGKRRR